MCCCWVLSRGNRFVLRSPEAHILSVLLTTASREMTLIPFPDRFLSPLLLPFKRCAGPLSGSKDVAVVELGGNTSLALVTEMDEGMIMGKSSWMIGIKAAIPNMCVYTWLHPSEGWYNFAQRISRRW